MAGKSTHVMPLVFSKLGNSEGLPFKRLKSLFCSFLALSGGDPRSSLRSTASWELLALLVPGMTASEREGSG